MIYTPSPLHIYALYSVLYSPHKCTQPLLRRAFVKLFQPLHELGSRGILSHYQHRAVERRPRMRTQVGFTASRPAPQGIGPACVTLQPKLPYG